MSTTEPPKVPVSMAKIAELAIVLGAHPMSKHQQCWEYQLDDQWQIAVNGHPEPRQCSHGVTVPPFSCYVQFNGWPAGFIDTQGGILCAGAMGNEDAFIVALGAAIEKATI